MSAARFVILCLGRTGSSHLVDLLDSHPRIRCWAEVLNEKHRGAAPEGWIGDSDAPDAVTHVRELLKLAPDGCEAAGFKLPLNSLRDHPEIGEWLERGREIAILRLRRRNSLALLVSRRLVRETLVSQSLYGSYGEARVRIEPESCQRALERIEDEDAELDRLAAGHPVCELAYERLGEVAELERAQRFLGVDPEPLRSRFRRLRTRPLEEAIENWEELSAALRGTRFELMLAESG